MSFDVIVLSFRLAADPPARVFERVLGLTRDDARARARRFPALAADGVPGPVAERLREALTGCGARVEVVEHGAGAPLLANAKSEPAPAPPSEPAPATDLVSSRPAPPAESALLRDEQEPGRRSLAIVPPAPSAGAPVLFSLAEEAARYSRTSMSEIDAPYRLGSLEPSAPRSQPAVAVFVAARSEPAPSPVRSEPAPARAPESQPAPVQTRSEPAEATRKRPAPYKSVFAPPSNPPEPAEAPADPPRSTWEILTGQVNALPLELDESALVDRHNRVKVPPRKGRVSIVDLVLGVDRRKNKQPQKRGRTLTIAAALLACAALYFVLQRGEPRLAEASSTEEPGASASEAADGEAVDDGSEDGAERAAKPLTIAQKAKAAMARLLELRMTGLHRVAIEWPEGVEPAACMLLEKPDDEKLNILREGRQQVDPPPEVASQLRDHVETMRLARGDEKLSVTPICLRN